MFTKPVVKLVPGQVFILPENVNALAPVFEIVIVPKLVLLLKGPTTLVCATLPQVLFTISCNFVLAGILPVTYPVESGNNDRNIFLCYISTIFCIDN